MNLDCRRPSATTVAQSRWDVPPHARWAWNGLAALYLPFASDGYGIPNRAPTSMPTLQWEVPPVYTRDGADMNGTGRRASGPLPAWLFEIRGQPRLSAMFSGLVPVLEGQGAADAGYFGIAATGASAAAQQLVGFQRNALYEVTTFVSSAPNGYYALTRAHDRTAHSVVVGTRTMDGLRMASNGETGLNAGPGLSDWTFAGTESISDYTVYMGSLAPGGECGATGSLGAIWTVTFNSRQLHFLRSNPYVAFTKWPRAWAGIGSGLTTRLLRPLSDLTNTGWVTP